MRKAIDTLLYISRSSVNVQIVFTGLTLRVANPGYADFHVD